MAFSLVDPMIQYPVRVLSQGLLVYETETVVSNPRRSHQSTPSLQWGWCQDYGWAFYYMFYTVPSIHFNHQHHFRSLVSYTARIGVACIRSDYDVC